MAFGESAALVGFVGFFAYDWWLYPLGLAFTAVGFACAAPNRRQLEDDQERLNERGCLRNLLHLLVRPSATA